MTGSKHCHLREGYCPGVLVVPQPAPMLERIRIRFKKKENNGPAQDGGAVRRFVYVHIVTYSLYIKVDLHYGQMTILSLYGL